MAAWDSTDAGRWAAGITVLAAVWCGMLLGVSFLATPAKFLAPSLSLPVALDVGRYTFAIFNKAEWLLALMLMASVLLGARTWPAICGTAIAVLLVIAETIWLLPELDQRVGAIITGQQPAPSNLHDLYVVFELVKLLALLFVIVVMAGKLVRSSPGPHSGVALVTTDGSADR